MENNGKYTLDWIISEMTPEWVCSEPELFIELVQYMKSEMDRRKEIITILKNTIEDLL